MANYMKSTEGLNDLDQDNLAQTKQIESKRNCPQIYGTNELPQQQFVSLS
jgi:hypothetical protein